MIRHMLFFSFAPHVDGRSRDGLLADLRALPQSFPAIRDFELGINLSSRDRTFEYGMTMTFAELGELEAYLTSDIHEAFVATSFRPLIESRAIVSFEC